jgi:hypothetical protein
MGIRVNVSEQENNAGDREPLPAGKFHVAITDMELQESQSDNNTGKPMLNFTFTVQDTPGSWQEFQGRKDFTNACLWSGATYTINMILKAMGKYEDCIVGRKGDEFELEYPTEPEFYLSEEMIIRRAVDPKQKKRWPDLPERWIQIRGIQPYDEETAHKNSDKREKEPAGAGSLMP